MRAKETFYRKLAYIAAMVVLLVPLTLVSRPATQTDPGGMLARMRSEHRLAQGEIGEIDPASEAMRLAALGLRGVAANILWGRANYYKKVEKFDEMNAAIRQIIKLQPNFLEVWEFQAHNISYNTSVEYDDYRFRYYWVKRGIDFLIEGTRYNRDEPKLLQRVGNFFEQKIGRSDEYRQFRRLFRHDVDYHETLRPYIPIDETIGADKTWPDSWLVAYQWMLEAQRAVDVRGRPLRGRSPLLFHSAPSMSLMYYAPAIEEEGYLDEIARLAWMDAGRSWHRYGNREIPTTWGFLIKLNEKEELEERIGRIEEELDALVPGVRDRLTQERRARLTPEQREALETPFDERTSEQHALASEAAGIVEVTADDVADAAPEETRGEARRKVAEIRRLQRYADAIRRYRDIVNFEYWRTRAEAEQTPEAIQARKHLFLAGRLYDAADLEGARREYEAAWDQWAGVFERFPALLEAVEAEDLIEPIERYRELLEVQLGEEFPRDFQLQELYDHWRKRRPDLIRDEDVDRHGPEAP